MNTIMQYVSQKVNGRNQTVAVFVASKVNEDVKIGWARANINAGDKFDKDKGIKIATERLKAKDIIPVPPSLSENAWMFSERCRRYYRTDFVKEIPVQK